MYSGTWYKGVREGYGESKEAAGQRYAGNWSNDEMVGEGHGVVLYDSL